MTRKGRPVPIPIDPRIKKVAAGFAFLEAPRWDNGRLYFSDFFTHRVHCMDTWGAITTLCEIDGQPSGLGFTRDGALLVVSMLDQRLMMFDDGKLSEYADMSGRFDGAANDLTVDAAGRAFVGNFGSDVYGGAPEQATCLLRVDPDHSISVVADGLEFPNGMAVTVDQTTLLVAESLECRITAFDLGNDGSLTRRRCWATFEPRPSEPTFRGAMASGAVIPDGISIDAEGALWVADSGGHTVSRIVEGGRILDSISCGESTAYAVALGGPNDKSLFICVGPEYGTYEPTQERSGELWVAEVDVPVAKAHA
jgi:sugar lactone lactonase YvrE